MGIGAGVTPLISFVYFDGFAPSLAAEYNAPIGPRFLSTSPALGATTPSIMGVLGITFTTPTPLFIFAVSSVGPAPTMHVDLFDATPAQVESTDVSLIPFGPPGSPRENIYSWAGPDSIKSAYLTFAPGSSWAIDNLTFDVPGPVAVPVPAAAALALPLLAGLAALRARKTRLLA